MNPTSPSSSWPEGAGSGQTLGDFRLLRELGRGGMGIVYEAEQLSLERRVALKVLPEVAALDPRRLQRFRNEAQAAALLHHTNIVPVHAVGCERGVHFYAMQLINGVTLAALLHARRHGASSPTSPESPASRTSPYLGPAPAANEPPPSSISIVGLSSASGRSYHRGVAELAAQVADALDHAHAHGVIHRDIKPGNLMIEANGHVWVTDFGLAQLAGDANLTQTGDIVGTLRYMSPEQLLGRRVPIDHRSDIYSLGVTLHELLTGRPAWDADDRQELIRQITFDEPVPPRRRDRSIPLELDTIVLKAMARSPSDRYASAGEFADDLRAFLDDRPIKARRATLGQQLARWGRRHRALVLSSVAALVVAVVALAISVALIWKEKGRVEVALESAETEWHRAEDLARKNELVADREAKERRRAERLLGMGLVALNEAFVDVAAERLPRGRAPGPTGDERLLRRALEFYRAYTREAPDEPRFQEEIAEAFRRVGLIYCRLGEYDQALEVSGSAVARFEALAGNGRDAALLRSLEIAHSTHGIILDLAGKPDEAQKAHARALAVCERCAETDEAWGKSRLAAILHNQAMIAFDREDYTQVLKLLDRAVSLQRAALKAKPTNERCMEFLHHHYTLRGNTRAYLNQLAESLHDLDQAFRLVQHLAAQRPGQRQSIQRLATGYVNRAIALSKSGQETQALALGQRGREIHAELYRQYPREASLRQEYARACAFVGGLLHRRKQLDEAITHMETAVGLAEQLVDQAPDVPVYVSELGRWSQSLSVWIGEPGAPEGALARKRHELRALEKRLTTNPLRAYRSALIHRLNESASQLIEATFKPAEALPLARRAHQLSREQLAITPDAAAREWVGRTGLNLALVLRHLRQFDESLVAHAAACEAFREVARLRNRREDESNLAWALSEQGLTLHDAGKVKDAEAAFAEALSRQRDLVAKQRDSEAMSRLGAILHNNALVPFSRHQWASAVDWLHQAVAAQKSALSLAANNRQAMKFLVHHYTRLAEVRRGQGDQGALVGVYESLVRDMEPRKEHFRDDDDRHLHLGRWQHQGAVVLLNTGRGKEGVAATRAALARLRRIRQMSEPAHIVLSASLHNLGRYEAAHGRLDAAQRLAEEALRHHLDSRDYSSQQPDKSDESLPQLYQQLGTVVARRGDRAYAARLGEVLAGLRPDSNTALRAARVLAVCAEGDEEYRPRVQAMITQAVRRCPAQAGAENYLAWVLLTKKDILDPQSALTLARRALSRVPDDGPMHSTLGIALYRSDDLPAAEKTLQRAIELRKGGDAHEWFFLAMIHARRGEAKEARALYDRAVTWWKRNAPTDEDLIAFEQEARALVAAK